MQIKVEHLDNNIIRINHDGDLKDFDRYINCLLFRFSNFNITPHKESGWICSVKVLNKLKTVFKVRELNDYVPPPYMIIGESMKLEPYEYQKEAIYEALENKETLMVLPCGSGKTPIIIGSYVEAKARNIITGQGLVVVKASLKMQWEKEVSKFSNYTGKALRSYSDMTKGQRDKIKKAEKELAKLKPTDKKRFEITNRIKELIDQANERFDSQFEGADLLIANYETLIDEKVLLKLKELNIEFIGADEIHYCKNRKADRSKALYELSNAKIKIGATATPITKDPRDIYGIFKFVSPDLLGLVSKFEKHYIKYAGFGKINGFKNMEELRDKIADKIFLKTKEEVSSHLPSLNIIKQYIDMTPKHVEAHERILQELDELNNKDFEIRRTCKSEQEALLNEELQKISAKVMALQTFAQELADSNELLLRSDSDMSKEYAINTSSNPKLDYCMELIGQILASGEKVIIFSKFERMQGILTEAINKLDNTIKIAYVNGSLSSSQRYTEAYEKFRDIDEYKVLLCSDAGAEGLNMSHCKYLIEYELATSYAIQTQRHGRLERADSIHSNVTVYQLIANGMWDNIQEKIIDKKEGFDNNIIKSIAKG